VHTTGQEGVEGARFKNAGLGKWKTPRYWVPRGTRQGATCEKREDDTESTQWGKNTPRTQTTQRSGPQEELDEMWRIYGRERRKQKGTGKKERRQMCPGILVRAHYRISHVLS